MRDTGYFRFSLADSEDEMIESLIVQQMKAERASASAARPTKRIRIDSDFYSNSCWGRFLRNGDFSSPSSKDSLLFRRRFRIPHSLFVQLLEETREWFPFYANTGLASRFGTVAVPIELKLLGVLRILGRAACFDEIKELSNMSEETIRSFFIAWMKKFREMKADIWIHYPTAQEPDAIRRITAAFAHLGFPGMIGSVDVVHFRWDQCPAVLAPYYKGKEHFATLGYEMVSSLYFIVTYYECRYLFI